MQWLDHDKAFAIQTIDKAYKQETISGIQRRRAIEILEVFKPTLKVKEKETKQIAVDEEILHAFKNWRH